MLNRSMIPKNMYYSFRTPYCNEIKQFHKKIWISIVRKQCSDREKSHNIETKMAPEACVGFAQLQILDS